MAVHYSLPSIETLAGAFGDPAQPHTQLHHATYDSSGQQGGERQRRGQRLHVAFGRSSLELKVTRGRCSSRDRQNKTIEDAENGLFCSYSSWLWCSTIYKDYWRPPGGELSSTDVRTDISFFLNLHCTMQLPYPKLASLNGAHFFASSLKAELRSCTNGGAKTVWKTFYDRYTYMSHVSLMHIT